MRAFSACRRVVGTARIVTRSSEGFASIFVFPFSGNSEASHASRAGEACGTLQEQSLLLGREDQEREGVGCG
jgi:hypothetical protein